MIIYTASFSIIIAVVVKRFFSRKIAYDWRCVATNISICINTVTVYNIKDIYASHNTLSVIGYQIVLILPSYGI